MLIRLVAITVFVTLAPLFAPIALAQPMCSGDAWGESGTSLQRTFGAGVRIIGTSLLAFQPNHSSLHQPACFGDLSVKAWIWPASAGGPTVPSCSEASNEWQARQVTYNSPHSKEFSVECIAIRGHSFKPVAFERWNFNTPEGFEGDPVYIPRDADNDEIEEDLDCDDTYWDPTNTCSGEPACGSECGGDPECEECECDGRDWLYWDGIWTCESPILIHLSSNTAQYHLTSATDGVLFDMNGDGVKQRISWTAAESVVGFLAMDRNGNGMIDDGRELFGNHTRKRDGTRAKHGFEALADLDDAGATGDQAITPTDAIYSRLLIWIDSNHNGISEPSELSSLSATGIVRIDTAYVERRRRDQHGNRYAYEGNALLVLGGETRERKIFDVFFARAR